MDKARIKAVAVLGYYFNRRLLRSVLRRDRADQAQLFQDYFREDRIAPFTGREADEIYELEGCVACGLCPAHCRVMSLSEGRFLGPMHLASAASRSQPEFIHDLDSCLLCAVCGQCEPICPERVPVAKIARTMRAMLWRNAPEALPQSYHLARENLMTHGNIHGPVPELELPRPARPTCALVLGPELRRDRDRSRGAFDLLKKVGHEPLAARDGALGGAAWALGLEPDDSWVRELAGSEVNEIVVADPEAWVFLRGDPRLADKKVSFIIEALEEKWPSGLSLKSAVKGPAAVHDPAGARASRLGRLVRDFLAAGGLDMVELDEPGRASPPLGHEGGVNLVEPELSKKLTAARREDARQVGAEALICCSVEDAAVLSSIEDGGGPVSVHILDLVREAFGL